jgi:hypothetical protein
MIRITSGIRGGTQMATCGDIYRYTTATAINMIGTIMALMEKYFFSSVESPSTR